MPDLSNEIPTSKNNEEAESPLREDALNPNALAQLKELSNKNNTGAPVANDLMVLHPELDNKSLNFKPGLPDNLNSDLKDLQKMLEKTQQQIHDLRLNCDSGLYDLEQSRRSMLGNPYKILTLGTGLAMMPKSYGFGAVPIAGFAALQGYDDVKNLLDQNTFAGRGKYTLGILADTAAGAGALGFLSEAVPMKYKAPLLIGGLVARAAIDFIPVKK